MNINDLELGIGFDGMAYIHGRHATYGAVVCDKRHDDEPAAETSVQKRPRDDVGGHGKASHATPDAL